VKYLNILVFYGNASDAIIENDVVVTPFLEGTLSAQTSLLNKTTYIKHPNISKELV